MININNWKPEITIDKIGKARFWLGILYGTLYSVIFCTLFYYSIEIFRYLTLWRGDPIFLPRNEYIFWDLFYAFFSTSIGFGITIYYWFNGTDIKFKQKRFKILNVSNTFYVSFFVLTIFTKIGFGILLTQYQLIGYDNHLDLYNHFRFIFIAIPIFIFFTHWNILTNYFRTKYWVLTSCTIFIVFSILLSYTFSVDKNIIYNIYTYYNSERLDFIDQELVKAKNYGINYSTEIKEIIQKRYAERTTNLVSKTQKLFIEDEKIPLEYLIIEKIFIHNMNVSNDLYKIHYGSMEEFDKNWPYAFPQDVYKHILKCDINSDEILVLFEILNEQIQYFINLDELTFKDEWLYSTSWYYNDGSMVKYDFEKIKTKKRFIFRTKTIQSKLIQVIEKLNTEIKYKKYHYLIPSFKFNDVDGKQFEIDLGL